MAAIIRRIFPDVQLYSREPYYIFTRNPLFIRQDSMKKLFAPPVKRRVLATKGPQGETIAMHVHEVKDKTIVVDLNHLLACKTLNFDVKVTDIKAAEAR